MDWRGAYTKTKHCTATMNTTKLHKRWQKNKNQCGKLKKYQSDKNHVIEEKRRERKKWLIDS